MLLPMLMAFAVLAGMIQWYWVPKYIQHEQDTWTKYQNQIIDAIKPYLIRDILSGDLNTMHITLDREVASHKEDWSRLVVLNNQGKQIYPLNSSPIVDNINLTRLQHDLRWQGQSIGTLVLTADFEHELKEERDNVLRLSQSALIVLMIFTILAVFLQNLWIHRPIKRLQRAAENLANGDANVPLSGLSNDELGQLTRTFSYMRDGMQAALYEAQASESRYRSVFDNAADGIVTINQNGLIESFNQAAEMIFGYRADEVINQPFNILISPSCFTEYQGYIQRYMETGNAQILGVTREVQGKRKDSSLLPMSLAVSEILINDRRLFCGVVSDITERKQAEHAIKQANELLASLVDNLQVGILVEDENRHILQANQLFCDLFDIEASPATLVGNDGTEGIARARGLFTDPDRFIDSSERCIAWKEVVVGEELELADSRILERDYIPVILQTEGQEIKYAHLWCYRDISGRKRIEAAVQEQSKLLELAAAEERALSALLRLALQPVEMETFLDTALSEVLGAVPWLKLLPKGAIFLTEDEGKGQELILTAKHNLSKELLSLCSRVPFGHCLCGRAAAECDIQFASCVDHRHDNHFDGMRPHGHYNAPLMQGDTVLGVIVLYLPHGHNKSEQEVTFLKRVADVVSIGISRRYANTALLQAKIAAEAAAKTKSAFLATMSHELRTPMNGVLGMAQILNGTELSHIQRQYVDTITQSGKALLVVINDILDFSKIEAGKLTLDPIVFDLEQAAHEVCQLLTGVTREKGLELILRYHPLCPRQLNGDVVRLRQILMNLIGNAIKFTAHGHILIDISHQELDNNQVRLRIEVQDTGIGIRKEVQSRLFNAFTQADGTTTRNFGGTGLGLAISKQLIKLMDGDIGVESSPGEGSVFWFTLTLARENKETLPDKTELKHIRTLLACNHQISCKVLYEQLQSLGMQVETCADADSTIDRLNQDRSNDAAFDLVVIDASIKPGLDVERLASNIRATPRFSNLPLVLLSSSAQYDDTQRLNEAGFNGYLTKPVLTSLLTDTLATVLDASRRNDLNNVIIKHNVALPDVLETETNTPCFAAIVLLVEDVEVNQQVATIMLKKLGLTVDLACNGEKAIEFWRTTKYDLILMDCQMPVMDGFQATRAIRHEEQQRDQHVPIVALTANALDSDRDNCLAAGMDDFLVKPFEEESLLALLKKHLPGRLIHDSDNLSTPAKDDDSKDLLDQNKFNQIVALMGSNIEPLINSFFTSTRDRLNTMKNAAINGQNDILKNETLALCSSSDNIGAIRLHELANELLQRTHEHLTDDTVNYIDKLDVAYAETKEFMRASLSIIKKPPGTGDESTSRETIDQDKYESMRATLGEEVFARLIPTFLDSVSNMLDEMGHAETTNDSTEIHRLAHSVKSASANVGAMQLSELAHALENKARDNDLNDLAVYLEHLMEAYREVQQAIELKSA